MEKQPLSEWERKGCQKEKVAERKISSKNAIGIMEAKHVCKFTVYPHAVYNCFKTC